jgi:hypothetical protein
MVLSRSHSQAFTVPGNSRQHPPVVLANLANADGQELITGTG